MNITAGLQRITVRYISNFYGDHEGINLAGFTQLEVNPVPKSETGCRYAG